MTDHPESPLFVPPGHFYSPLPDLREVRAQAERLFHHRGGPLPGIDLNPDGQRRALEELLAHHDEAQFPHRKAEGLRYFSENPQFPYGDAAALAGFLRHWRPARLVEIGAGYSTCVVLDTAERHLDPSFEITCIEPYPDRLLSLVNESDLSRIRLIDAPVQDVGAEVFLALEAGDVLFIDSSHVSKIGSDVNHLLFEVLPQLASGVYVHFHDILFPFEYPEEWVFEGRAWNEAYLLRAFLQFNSAFRIYFWSTFVLGVNLEWVQRAIPRVLHEGAASLWLQKT